MPTLFIKRFEVIGFLTCLLLLTTVSAGFAQSRHGTPQTQSKQSATNPSTTVEQYDELVRMVSYGAGSSHALALLKAGVSPNGPEGDESTAFMAAFDREPFDVALVEMLLKHGADIRLPSPNYDKMPVEMVGIFDHKALTALITPLLNAQELKQIQHAQLYYALAESDLSRLIGLLKQGALLDHVTPPWNNSQPDVSERYPFNDMHPKILNALESLVSDDQRGHLLGHWLYYALENERDGLVKQLLQQGADLRYMLSSDPVVRPIDFLPIIQSPTILALLEPLFTDDEKRLKRTMQLHSALAQNDLEQVKALIEQGAKFDSTSSSLQKAIRALMYEDNNHEVLVFMLDQGLDPSMPMGETTLFHQIMVQAELRTVEYFLASIKDINLIDRAGDTPLLLALNRDDAEQAVALLLQNRADPNLAGQDDTSPLQQVLTNRHPKLVQLLLEHGAQFTVGQDQATSFLEMVLDLDSEAILTASMAAGLKVDVSIHGGGNAFHYGVKHNRAPLLARMAKQGLDLNVYDDQGRTPLTLALHNKQSKLAQQLVELGADPNFADRQGVRPLHMVLAQGNDPLALWLLSHGVDPSLKGHGGKNTLSLAIIHGVQGVMDALLKQGIATDQADGDGLLPWHYAILHGHTGVLKQLVAQMQEPKQTTEPYGLFESPLVHYWNALYLAYAHERLKSSLERNLNSDHPHPIAVIAWVTLNNNDNAFEQVWQKLHDQKLKNVLAPYAVWKQMDVQEREAQALKLYPPDYAFKKHDLFALIKLAYAAKALSDYEQMMNYLTVAVRLDPNVYQMAWVLSDSNLLEKPIMRQKVQALLAEPGVQNSQFAKMIAPILSLHRRSRDDERYLTEQWLQSFPHDGRAWTSLGYDLKSNNRHEAALLAHLKGLVFSPFYANYDNGIDQLVKLNRPDQALAYSKILAPNFSQLEQPSERELDGWSRRQVAYAFKDAGNYGKARQLAEDEIKVNPGSIKWRVLLAKIEKHDKRFTHALEQVQAIRKLDPKDHTGRTLEIELLQSLKRHEQALVAWQALKKDTHTPDRALLHQGVELMGALGKKEQQSRLLEQIAQRFPLELAAQLAWAEQLVKMGKHQQAFDLLKAQLEQNPQHEETIKALHQSATKVLDKGAVLPFWQRQLAHYPWSKVLHTWYASNQLKNQPERVAFWRGVVARTPDRLWGHEQLSDLYLNKQKWGEALAILRNYQHSVAASSQSWGERLFVRILIAWVVNQQSRKQRVDKALIKQQMESLNIYRDEGGNLDQYHRYMVMMQGALGHKKKAAEHVIARSKFNLDSTSIYSNLATDYQEHTRDEAKAYGYTMVRRDPYNIKKSQQYVRFLNFWLNGPILSLKHIDRVKKLGLDTNLSYYEKKARSKLGDTVSGFASYMGSKAISDSDRYVNWYHNARKQVLTKDRNQIHYKFENDQAEVEIIYPNGEVLTRRDHPIFGKIVHLGMGASYISAKYDDRGNLSQMRTSAGKQIDLIYDSRDLITSMVGQQPNKPDQVLSFEYGALEKPTLIRIEGVGAIRVRYDAQGEIESVKSDQGHRMALKVTQAFQNLLSMAKIFENYQRNDRLPRIPFTDVKHDALQQSMLSSRGLKRQEAELAYAHYLVEHIADNRDYYSQAKDLLEEHIEAGIHQSIVVSEPTQAQQQAAQAIALWSQLHLQVKPRGLPVEDFEQWSTHRNWLRGMVHAGVGNPFGQVLAKLDERPQKLLKDTKWLAHSELTNEGFWHRYTNRVLGGESASRHTLLIRQNGDVLVGGDKGLNVFTKGHWVWMGYDALNQRFSSTISKNSLKASAQVLALAEDKQGTLWVGTANGLIRLAGPTYAGETQYWMTQQQGLAAPRVTHLAFHKKGGYVATSAGIQPLTKHGPQPPLLMKGEVSFLSAAQEEEHLLVGQADGVYALNETNTPVKLHDKPMQDAVYLPESKWLYMLSGDRIYRVVWDGLTLTEGKPLLLATKADVLAARAIHGLSRIPVTGKGDRLGVLTDQGLALFHEAHFQYMEMPFSSARGGLKIGPELAAQDHRGNLWLSAQDGVYGFRFSDVRQDKRLPVVSIAVDHKQGITYLARGKRIDYVDHDDPQMTPRFFNQAAATQLAMAADGSLLANDHHRIIRFFPGNEKPYELFEARSTPDKAGWQGPVKNILPTADGTIWVASGSSIFRWKTGQKAEEFNWLMDAKRFPSRSEMISRVFENVEGHIQVIASDEGHLEEQGVELSGGLLQWNGEGFDRLKRSKRGFFVTGYTKLDDTQAVVGTSDGFFQDRKGAPRRNYTEIHSYAKLKERFPMLWLGRKGAALGKDKKDWIFPAAGGVVLYHDGRWFYPDRLNQLLPEDRAFGQYGARTVHAVATDPKGRIYMGTDLGLTIYEAHNVTSLLIDNGYAHSVFADQESQQQAALKDIFLDKIDPASKQGRILTRYQALDRELNELKAHLTGGGKQNNSGIRQTSGGEGARAETQEETSQSYKKRLKSRERAMKRLLNQLEQDHYGLFQMLRLDPRELQAMRKELKAGELMVQYLPTPQKLFIQLASRDASRIVEVQVPSQQLFERVVRVARILQSSVDYLKIEGRLTRNKRGHGFSLKDEDEDDLEFSAEQLNEDLHWLYQQLLRPVEYELDQAKQVYLTPVGPLTYLPFSALIRAPGQQPEYAAQRYQLGVMPSLFHLNLVLRAKPSFADDVLLLADPDGSLPGARAEVKAVGESLESASTKLIGAEASLESMTDAISDKRIVHLATHGLLDQDKPADSYLLLAGKSQLGMVDIAMLDLEQTDLVVLSACQSGIGRDGMEYVTLARAFAHAQVPTVVASLWSVHDQATLALMRRFYGHLDEGKNIFSALARAQREMIDMKGDLAHPAAWAAFNVFGRP
ncbi:CHAT domain-containing protein [Magnetococcus sp. PR-3]|uniref:CHAT domain-containing protein n=1 Tax=Magnetococcus sp. PR-3 TaxID=3120355 RepID=UPI002FCE4906